MSEETENIIIYSIITLIWVAIIIHDIKQYRENKNK
jgi:hypothetical protein